MKVHLLSILVHRVLYTRQCERCAAEAQVAGAVWDIGTGIGGGFMRNAGGNVLNYFETRRTNFAP